MLPQTFAEWSHCITHDCGFRLTADFAKQRLNIYRNPDNKETQRFLALYGLQHLQNVTQWFNQILTQ